MTLKQTELVTHTMGIYKKAGSKTDVELQLKIFENIYMNTNKYNINALP